MLDPSKIVVRASTQEFLDIEDVRDDLVILRDGSACLLVQTTALNFGLLSEREQDATIFAYAGFLNSLTFPIQIVVRSKKKDVTSYLSLLKNQEAKQTNELLKNRIRKYRQFIEATVKNNNVLDKKFYIVIPFSSLELGVSSAMKSFVKQESLPFPKDYIIGKAKTALAPKRDHVLRLLNRLGLKGKQLSTRELIELFFSIYNPDETNPMGAAEIATSSKPLVQPAMATGTRGVAPQKPTENQNPSPKKQP